MLTFTLTSLIAHVRRLEIIVILVLGKLTTQEDELDVVSSSSSSNAALGATGLWEDWWVVRLRREAGWLVADLVIKDDHSFSVHNAVFLVG